MRSFTTEQLRNLAVIGHGDAGKTQLTASLAYVAGATPRWGKVDEGTAVTDYDDDSIERKVSLNNNFTHLEYKDAKINIIDTPGYAAFVAHARPALRVADCAIVVVDGVHGIEVQTEKTWQYANEFILPRFMVINKIDKEHADFGHALETATSSFALDRPIYAAYRRKEISKASWTSYTKKPTASTPQARRLRYRYPTRDAIFLNALGSVWSRSSRNPTML